MLEIENFILKFHKLESDSFISDDDDELLEDFHSFLDHSHYKRRKAYLEEFVSFERVIRYRPFIWLDYQVEEFEQARQNLINLGKRILEENKKVFIVHGRNMNMCDKVEALLGKLRIENTVLENESNSGSTIIEKFISKSEDCRYAIVLMSPDDEGRLEGGVSRKRARQNVILELGYFLGKLGRERIIVLHTDETDIEKPSDFEGIVYLPYDNKGAWKHRMIKELKQSGFYIDEKDVDKV